METKELRRAERYSRKCRRRREVRVWACLLALDAASAAVILACILL